MEQYGSYKHFNLLTYFFFPTAAQVTSQFTQTPRSPTACRGTLTSSWPSSVHTAAWCVICLDMTMKEATTWTRRLGFTMWPSRAWLKRRPKATPLVRWLCTTTGWCWRGTEGLRTECFFSLVDTISLIRRQNEVILTIYIYNEVLAVFLTCFFFFCFFLMTSKYLIIVFGFVKEDHLAIR